MPLYEFTCTDCNSNYESLTKYDETEVYESVQCPHCQSFKKTKKPSMASLTFKDPTTSSKWDNFSYRAGYNLDKAQNERRFAEANSHVGSNPYNQIDDTHLGEGMHHLSPLE